MDQAASKGGTAMSATPEERHDKSPEEIRDEIEQTREELGDTVETLAAKTDVKMQVKKRIARSRTPPRTRRTSSPRRPGR